MLLNCKPHKNTFSLEKNNRSLVVFFFVKKAVVKTTAFCHTLLLKSPYFKYFSALIKHLRKILYQYLELSAFTVTCYPSKLTEFVEPT